MKWWELEENKLSILDNTEDEITFLYGRETPDGWEYAKVSKFDLEEPCLEFTFKNGKITMAS